jgi:hypothetical protein
VKRNFGGAKVEIYFFGWSVQGWYSGARCGLLLETDRREVPETPLSRPRIAMPQPATLREIRALLERAAARDGITIKPPPAALARRYAAEDKRARRAQKRARRAARVAARGQFWTINETQNSQLRLLRAITQIEAEGNLLPQMAATRIAGEIGLEQYLETAENRREQRTSIVFTRTSGPADVHTLLRAFAQNERHPAILELMFLGVAEDAHNGELSVHHAFRQYARRQVINSAADFAAAAAEFGDGEAAIEALERVRAKSNVRLLTITHAIAYITRRTGAVLAGAREWLPDFLCVKGRTAFCASGLGAPDGLCFYAAVYADECYAADRAIDHVSAGARAVYRRLHGRNPRADFAGVDVAGLQALAIQLARPIVVLSLLETAYERNDARFCQISAMHAAGPENARPLRLLAVSRRDGVPASHFCAVLRWEALVGATFRCVCGKQHRDAHDLERHAATCVQLHGTQPKFKEESQPLGTRDNDPVKNALLCVSAETAAEFADVWKTDSLAVFDFESRMAPVAPRDAGKLQTLSSHIPACFCAVSARGLASAADDAAVVSDAKIFVDGDPAALIRTFAREIAAVSKELAEHQVARVRGLADAIVAENPSWTGAKAARSRLMGVARTAIVCSYNGRGYDLPLACRFGLFDAMAAELGEGWAPSVVRSGLKFKILDWVWTPPENCHFWPVCRRIRFVDILEFSACPLASFCAGWGASGGIVCDNGGLKGTFPYSYWTSIEQLSENLPRSREAWRDELNPQTDAKCDERIAQAAAVYAAKNMRNFGDYLRWYVAQDCRPLVSAIRGLSRAFWAVAGVDALASGNGAPSVSVAVSFKMAKESQLSEAALLVRAEAESPEAERVLGDVAAKIAGYAAQDAEAGRECSLTADDVSAVLERESWRCRWCRVSLGSAYTLDRLDNCHGHSRENCVAACSPCNCARSAAPVRLWRQQTLDQLFERFTPCLMSIADETTWRVLKAGITGGLANSYRRHCAVGQTLQKPRWNAETRSFELEELGEPVTCISSLDSNSMYPGAMARRIVAGKLRYVAVEENAAAQAAILAEIRGGGLFGYVLADWTVPETEYDRWAQFCPFFVTRDFDENRCSPATLHDMAALGMRPKTSRRLMNVLACRELLCDSDMAKWYLEQRLVCTNVRGVIRGVPSDMFAGFVQAVADARTAADRRGIALNAEIEKLAAAYAAEHSCDIAVARRAVSNLPEVAAKKAEAKSQEDRANLLKLVANSAYGRSLMQTCEHESQRVVQVEEFDKIVATNSRFRGAREHVGGWFECSLAKQSAPVWKLPIQLGISTYCRSKLALLQMLDFMHRRIPRSRFCVLGGDTDCLLTAFCSGSPVTVSDEHLAARMQNGVSRDAALEACYVDLSLRAMRDCVLDADKADYDEEAPRFLAAEKGSNTHRQPLLFKCEFMASESIYLAPKSYMLVPLDARGKSKSACKGYNRARKALLAAQQYRDVLFGRIAEVSGENRGIQQIADRRGVQHGLATVSLQKRVLSAVHCKRFVCDDRVNTFPYLGEF